jgi:hypothetical protein
MIPLESFIRTKHFVQIYAEISHRTEHVNPKSVIFSGRHQVSK